MIKVALLLCSAAVCTAEYRKNSKPELQNQFLFCNMFLLFVQYLHGGQEDFSNDRSGLKGLPLFYITRDISYSTT